MGTKKYMQKMCSLAITVLLVASMFIIFQTDSARASADDISIVQYQHAEAKSVSSLNVVFSTAPTQGNVLYATVYINQPTLYTPSFSQTGVTWNSTPIISAQYSTDHFIGLYTGIVDAGAATTLTITLSGAATIICAATAEYTGTANPVLVDKTANNVTGSSILNPQTGITGTTTYADQLCIGAIAQCYSTEPPDPNPSSPTNDFTLHAGGRVAFLEKIVNTTGTQGSGVTYGSARPAIGVIATFRTPPTYIITAEDDEHSTITPSGEVNVTQGANQTFTISTDAGYSSVVYVDGANMGSLTEYTFTNVQEAHTIAVYSGNYAINGPYYEDGTVDTLVTATVYYYNGSSEQVTLNGTAGVAQTVILNSSYLPQFVTYNFTSSYNFTRIYYFSNESETVKIYIPRLTDAVQQYSINVICLGTLSNAYVYTTENIGGVNTVIEKQPLDAINAMPFWLSMYRQYYLYVSSDQGTWSWTLPADTIATKTFTITADMVDSTVSLNNITATATRVNGTAVSVYYYDSDDITTSITTQIMHLSSGTWVVDYTQTDLASATQSFTMTNASASINYVANITAVRNTGTVHYQLAAPKPESNQAWIGAFDTLGVWPVPSYQLPAIFICLFIFGIGSWRDSDALAIIGLIVCGILQVIGWGYFPAPGIAFAFMVVVFAYLHRGKQEATLLES